MDSDSSSEDEVFFGPVTAKEKRIAARHHGRKTLILPRRNPLYCRWSTTHIPVAFTTRENEITTGTSDFQSQDCCSHESSKHLNRLDDSMLLSKDVGDNDIFRTSTEATRASFEASHQGVSPLTLTNSSCCSSMGNIADDERSICSTKLSHASSPMSPIPAGTTQWHEPYAVTSLSHHSPASPKLITSKSTIIVPHFDFPTSLLAEESGQRDNFSSHHCDQSSPQSPAPAATESVPACDILAFSALTDQKVSTACPEELCASFMDLSVRHKEPDSHLQESRCSPKDTDFSTIEPDCCPRKPSNNRKELPYGARQPFKSHAKPGCNLSVSDRQPRKSLRNPRKPDCNELSNNLIEPHLRVSESRSIPRESTDRVSESSCNSREPSCRVNKSHTGPRQPDCKDSESLSCFRKPNCIVIESCIAPREPDYSLYEPPNITRELDCILYDSTIFLREHDCKVNKSCGNLREPACRVSESLSILGEPDYRVRESPSTPRESGCRVIESPNITREPDGTVSESPNITRELDGTASESPNNTREPDGTASESPNNTREPDGTASESPNNTREPDGTASEFPNNTREPDGTVSESPNNTREPDGTASESPNNTREPDGTVSESPNNTREPDGTASESPNNTREPDGTVSESPNNTREPDGTVTESLNNTREPDGTVTESPNNTREPDGTVTESPNNTREPDGTVSESPNNIRELDGTVIESPNITREPDGTASESPNNTRELDGTVIESPNITREPDGTVSESSNITGEPDGTVSESPNSTKEPDCTVSQSQNITREPSGAVSESSSITREPDCTVSQSPNITREPGGTVSQSPNSIREHESKARQSPNIPRELDCSLSESLSNPRNSNCIFDESTSSSRKPESRVNEPLICLSEPEFSLREPPSTPKKYDCSPKESDCSFNEPECSSRGSECSPTEPDCSLGGLECSCREPDCSPKEPSISLKEHPSKPTEPDCSLTELHSYLDDPDSNPKETVNRVLDCNSMQSPNSVRKLNSAIEFNTSASFSASPRFNDTLEEIELFLKYGANYGEEGTSPLGGHHEYITTLTHNLREPECSLGSPCTSKVPSNNHNEPPSISRRPSNNHSDHPSNLMRSFNNSREPPSTSKEPSCSSKDLNYKINEPHNSLLGSGIDPVESVSTHGESNCNTMKSLTSLEKPGDSNGELLVSASFPVSPTFNDTLEEVEEFLKYGVDCGEKDTSCENQKCITNLAHSSCPSNLQPPVETNQISSTLTEVVHVKGKKSPDAALGEKQLHEALLQVEEIPLCSTSKANTLHTSIMQSLPLSATSATQLGLTRPTQRVTPTSRAPLNLPRSQLAKGGQGSATKTTPTLKLIRSTPSSHTPTTSRMQQPQTARARLHLGSPVLNPTPRSTGLPPHPQRRAAVGYFVPKKTQASTSDGHHRRVLWHNKVASPLAKELRNNPPPPLVINVKPSSSCSPGRWQSPPSHACQISHQLSSTSSCNFSKGDKVQKIAAGETYSPQVCLDGNDGQILPVTNYKTGKSIVLGNKNKENIRRQCCKAAPTREVKVIKHTGRLMVAKPQSISQSRQNERTSMMEVSIHQPLSID